VILTAGERLEVRHRQREADRRVAHARFDRVVRETVGPDQGVVGAGVRVEVLLPRRKRAEHVPEERHHVGFVERARHTHEITEVIGRPFAESREPLGGARVFPSAVDDGPPRRREVVEREDREQIVLVAAREHPSVVVEGRKRELTLFRLDARPLE